MNRTSIAITIFFLGFLLISSCSEGPKVSYWENGNVQSELSYKDEKLDGKCTWYFQNGNKEQEANYIKNKLNGQLTRWYINGNLE